MLNTNTLKVATLLLFLVLSFLPKQGESQSIEELKEKLKDSDAVEKKVEIILDMFPLQVQLRNDSLVVYARKAYELARQTNDNKLIEKTIYNLGNAFRIDFQPDSLKYYLDINIGFVKDHDMEDLLPSLYRNMAVYGEMTNQPDTSLLYLDLCESSLQVYPDSFQLGNVYLSRGFAYRVKGEYPLSIENLRKAETIFTDIENYDKLGYTLQNIGIAYAMNDKVDEALTASRVAMDHFKKSDNYRAIAQTTNNMGFMTYREERLEESIEIFKEAIYYAQLSGQEWVALNAHWNRGRAHYSLGQLTDAKGQFDSVYFYAEQLGDDFKKGGALRWKSRIAADEGSFSLSKSILKESNQYVGNYEDPTFNLEVYEELADVYEAQQDYKNAFKNYTAYSEMKDSIFTLEKNEQFEELKIQYETAKKDAEIAELNAEQLRAETKFKLLLIGLITAFISGISLIYALQQKRKKEKLKLQNEREIAIAQKETAEEKLASKQRELTASVLQVAKKNEFLAHLKEEVAGIKSSIDGKVSNASRKISRLIDGNTNDEDSWLQFSNEFSQAHGSFLDNFIKDHGNFSQTEIRHLCLMKMNLSTKDIANILNISTDGVKKARYRLKKKIKPEGDLNLQDYILRRT